MPELLKLHNIGTKGLSTDIEPWELPADFITSGVNFRVYSGSLITAGGHTLWSTPSVSFTAGRLLHVGATLSDYWMVLGRDAVYAWDSLSWFDISSAVGYGSINVNQELKWSMCMLGGIPVVNNPDHVPEYWSPVSSGQILQPLQFDAGNTWAAKGFSFKVIRSFKNFLFALNLVEGGVEQPDSYRWSHPADTNGLPFTWDDTDVTALASKESLGGDGGKILDGLTLRDSFVIYSENAISILDFTGTEFVFKRRNLSSTHGLLTTDCVVEVNGRHYFMTNGDIMMNDGANINSIAHDRIRTRFNANLNQDFYKRAYAARNDDHKEIWFCIPEGDATYPNTAFIYNWKDDSWVIRSLPDNIAHIGYGSYVTGLESWEDQGDETWDSSVKTWGGNSETSPLDDTLIGVDNVNSALYNIDPLTISDVDVSTRVERVGFPLVDTREVTTITRVYPKMSGTGDVSIQFGSQDYPDSPIRWKDAITFSPGKDRKIDLRTTGEFHCWRFDSVGKNNWTLSGMGIEFELAGKR